MRIYQAARISRTNEVLLTFSIVGAPIRAPRRGRTATRPRAITPDGWGNHAGLPLHGHTDTDQQMSTRPSLIPVKRPSKLFLLLALLVLLGFGLYLRAYRLDELVIWLGDQGRDVTATWRMMQTGEPALLGPGSSVGRFQRGPIYYYLLLAGVAAGGGNPLGAA